MNHEHLYGLVVCGGRSSRMSTDKSLINYHGVPQRYHVYNMLNDYCEKVFLSCNSEQSEQVRNGILFIADLTVYENIGPMAALLSAFELYPGRSFLAVGCDYPMITSDEIKKFIASIHDADEPAAFFNPAELFYEPLLAYYPANAGDELKSAFMQNNYSLQSYLRKRNAFKYVPPDITILTSINAPHEAATVHQLLNQTNERRNQQA